MPCYLLNKYTYFIVFCKIKLLSDFFPKSGSYYCAHPKLSRDLWFYGIALLHFVQPLGRVRARAKVSSIQAIAMFKTTPCTRLIWTMHALSEACDWLTTSLSGASWPVLSVARGTKLYTRYLWSRAHSAARPSATIGYLVYKVQNAIGMISNYRGRFSLTRIERFYIDINENEIT